MHRLNCSNCLVNCPRFFFFIIFLQVSGESDHFSDIMFSSIVNKNKIYLCVPLLVLLVEKKPSFFRYNENLHCFLSVYTFV
ncbi:hypothetical protein P5673_014333 [Acropora cervicornis]|uniref:Secreted protein n=1 Tax=Acropora cervicornis TaxID=6130 RepID=A0AAD9QJX5_ACRCE|nr:hypothetical protein P5673_014333 [Acropora cervicornis]